MTRSLLRNLIIAALLFTASGCLIRTSNSTYESGNKVSERTLRQVEPGKTTDAWLIATLGEPTSRAPVRGPDHTEIWGYSHQVIESSSGKLFLIFSGSDREMKRSQTYFEIQDGVVMRYWTEE